MAQSRSHKIGTVYSRVRNLIDKKALKEEHKPIWFEIYEAFPPKYEPRYDRHMITFGTGSNVAKMPEPSKILYKEDEIRAKYYKAFMPKSESNQEKSLANTEIFNLLQKDDLGRKTLSQIFLEKYQKLRDEGKYEEEQLFMATIEAVEMDGINLRGPPIVKETIKESEERSSGFEFPSIDDLMEKDEENKPKDS